MSFNTIQQFFEAGMKRQVNMLAQPNKHVEREGFIINLGAGNNPIGHAINLDYPEWDGENYLIEIPNGVRNEWVGMPTLDPVQSVLVPCPDECVDEIHAYHFLEHLRDPARMLREIQRVMRPGGVVNIVVPHYAAAIAFEDLDHKKQFTLDTWKTLFKNEYYDKHHKGWKFRIHFNMLMAITERNACIFTQLIKGD